MLINNNNMHNYNTNSFTDRRRASIERAFSIRTKVFVVTLLCVVVMLMFFEAEVIQAYIPEDSTFDTPVLRKVYDPKLTQYDQHKFRSHEIFLRLSDVSDMDLLEQPRTPQNQAYQWIVNDDPLKLGIDDHNLVQRYVLALLWFSTTSHGHVWDQHHNNDMKWLSASHECYWNSRNNNNPSGGGGNNNKGVMMCTDDLQVKSVQLANTNLHGQLPPELQQLTKLVYLDLQNNALTGEVPSELGKLMDLDYMGLSTNQFRGTIPDTLARLRSMGVLFNLWSDCDREEGGLECECCTVCCATNGQCSPREQSGPEQESEVPPNGAISAVSIEEAMINGKLPTEMNPPIANQIPNVATLDQTSPTKPESTVVVVQNNPGVDEKVQRLTEHQGFSDPGSTNVMPSLPNDVSSPLRDEAKQAGGSGEIQTSAAALQGNAPPLITSSQEQPSIAATMDPQKEQASSIRGRDELGAHVEEKKTYPPSNRVDPIDASMVIQGSGPPIINAPQAQNETTAVMHQQEGTELVNA